MSGTLNLLFMRHGETIINKNGRTQGWCDGVLTKEGKEIAIKAGKGLKNMKFKNIYCSDLGRAIKTSQIVINENNYKENLQLNELESLREVYFGKYEGEKEVVMMTDILNYLNAKTIEEASQNREFQKSFCNACAVLDETKEAENYNSAFKRIMDSVKYICKENYEENKENTVLIVTHGGILRLLLDRLDKSFNLRHIYNASISKIIYDGKNLKVISVNDLSHL